MGQLERFITVKLKDKSKTEAPEPKSTMDILTVLDKAGSHKVWQAKSTEPSLNKLISHV